MLLVAAVDGIVLGAWQSLHRAGRSPAGHCLQNSWNSRRIRHWVVGANSSYPAKVGRTAVSLISASANEVVFEVLFKKILI